MERHQREELLATWLETYRGLVLKVVLAYAEEAEREDLFQEIWLTLWLALEDYVETAKPSTFIYRVALNRAINWRRTRRRYHKRVETWEVLPPLIQDPGEREELAALYAAIQQLAKLEEAVSAAAGAAGVAGMRAGAPPRLHCGIGRIVGWQCAITAWHRPLLRAYSRPTG